MNSRPRIYNVIAGTLLAVFIAGFLLFMHWRDQMHFKQSFGFDFPKNRAEQDAIRPVIIKQLQRYIAAVTNCQSELTEMRKKAEALPADGPEDMNRRFSAFTECEGMEKRLARLDKDMYDAAIALEGVGWTEVAKSAGIQMRGSGGPW